MTGLFILLWVLNLWPMQTPVPPRTPSPKDRLSTLRKSDEKPEEVKMPPRTLTSPSDSEEEVQYEDLRFVEVDNDTYVLNDEENNKTYIVIAGDEDEGDIKTFKSIAVRDLSPNTVNRLSAFLGEDLS